MSNDTIVIDTPAGMAHFHMCQVIAALSIEVRTGLSHSRGSVLKVAQQHFGVTKSTKAGALAQMKALYAETYGREYGA